MSSISKVLKMSKQIVLVKKYEKIKVTCFRFGGTTEKEAVTEKWLLFLLEFWGEFSGA
jgi:hypothetical protein